MTPILRKKYNKNLKIKGGGRINKKGRKTK